MTNLEAGFSVVSIILIYGAYLMDRILDSNRQILKRLESIDEKLSSPKSLWNALLVMVLTVF